MPIPQEIYDFYQSLDLPIEKQIIRRPARVKPEQVMAAAVKLYREIHEEDLKIKPINMVWRIWAYAKDMVLDPDSYDYKTVKDLRDRTDYLEWELRRSWLERWFEGLEEYFL